MKPIEHNLTKNQIALRCAGLIIIGIVVATGVLAALLYIVD